MKNRSLLEIHVAVLLFGLAGLFGKFLAVPALVIVFGRTFFATLVLSALLVFGKQKLPKTTGKDLVMLISLGALLAFHWFTFFYSIQISTVAVGLLSFSSFPLFVTFLEPWIFREKLKLFDLISAALVLAGLVLVIPAFDFENNITQGVFWGTLSGFSFAILSLMNRKYVSAYAPVVIAWYQNGIASLVLIPFLFFWEWQLGMTDLFWLVILGVFCTALAHALFIKSLGQIKTQLASIITGLEPVYGIVFAFFLLDEIPSLRTLLGGGIILGAVLFATLGRKVGKEEALAS